MNTGLILFGKFIRLIGKLLKIIAALCMWLAILSLLGFAYKLIDTMIPNLAYQIMLQDNLIGRFFAWYYVHVYLAYPIVQIITYYLTTWGGAVLIVLFRVLRSVFKFLSDKFILWGTNLTNRGLTGKARAKSEENGALVQELNRQIAANQALRQQNAELRSRRPVQNRISLTDRAREAFYQIKQREADEAAEQEDAWGKWSRRK